MDNQLKNQAVSRRKIRWLTKEPVEATVTILHSLIAESEEADIEIRCYQGHKIKVRGMQVQHGFWFDSVLIVGKCRRCKTWHGVVYGVYAPERHEHD